MPRVTVVLPTLNSRRFLDRRIDTIANQQFDDWEVVAIDSDSSDGTWERLQQWAAHDTRVRVLQAPRGLYECWNRGVAAARGEFVCIATSDDTMEPGFLATMVRALDENPDCALAHCKLRIIDERGGAIDAMCWDYFPSTMYFGPLIDQPHIRLAPHDGLLHCGVQSVYTSITQLLIRRTLFERIGGFNSSFGSFGDFEWSMRAGLLVNTIHVPEYLASWRLHSSQATNVDQTVTPWFFTMLLRMVRSALSAAAALEPGILSRVRFREVKRFYAARTFHVALAARSTRTTWLPAVIRAMAAHPLVVTSLVLARARGADVSWSQDGAAFCRHLLALYGFHDSVRLVDSSAVRAAASSTSMRDGR